MSAHWRRRRREIVGRPVRHDRETSLTTAILTLAAGALLTVVTGLWIMLQLEQFGPAVGGIIVFRPDTAAGERWSVRAALAEPAAGVARDPRHCVLSPAAMARRGGSLLVEARRMSRPPEYRVHWAGGSTNFGTDDCGATADLVLERTELMRLANVAGGFNSGMRLIGP